MASTGQIGLHKVFVYGTLKTDQPNHHHMLDKKHGYSRFLATAKTRDRFPLVVATKFKIPFLLHQKGQGHEVVGEVYEVDDAVLKFLDSFEEHPRVYQRTTLEVILDSVADSARSDLQSGPLECGVYVMLRFPSSWRHLQFIPSYSSKDCSLDYNEDDIDSLEEYLKTETPKEGEWIDTTKS